MGLRIEIGHHLVDACFGGGHDFFFSDDQGAGPYILCGRGDGQKTQGHEDHAAEDRDNKRKPPLADDMQVS
jgi:hypothetical protein